MPEEHKQLSRENKLHGDHYWKEKDGTISNKSWSGDPKLESRWPFPAIKENPAN